MGMGAFAKGWPAGDDRRRGGGDSSGGGGGGGGGMPINERLYKFRFNVPEPAKNPLRTNDENPEWATKRVLILSDFPTRVYDHSLYKLKNVKDFFALCLKENGLHDECPLCAKNGGDLFSSLVGFFYVIDMGQVERIPVEGGKSKIKLHHDYKDYENKESKGMERRYFAFQKKLMGARQGSQSKPGMLPELQFEAQNIGGSMEYTVWETSRSGRQVESIGNKWRFIKKLTKEQVVPYLVHWGAEEKDLDLTTPHMKGTAENPGPFWVDPHEYYDKLSLMVGWKPLGGNREPAKAEGAGWGDNGSTENTGQQSMGFNGQQGYQSEPGRSEPVGESAGFDDGDDIPF